MLTIIIIVAVILMTIGIVWLIDKFVPKKFKPYILIVLWIIIGYLGYITFNSVYGEIKFNELKNERYSKVIPNLIDIRDSQLAYRTVNGKFTGNFDSLVRFIDTAQFTITQRRDSTVLDEEQTRIFRVDTYKDIVLIDTLDYVPVKDSLFKGTDRYKTMMNVPAGKPGSNFELKAGFIEQNDIQIPVFESKILKSIILYDQPENFVAKENQVISVDQVNGNSIIVGSMEEVNTNGNWPKNYSNQQ